MKFKSLILGVSAGLFLAGVSTTFGQTTNAISIPNFDFNSDTAADNNYANTTVGWTLQSFSGSAVNATINRTSTPYTGQTGNQLGQIFALNNGWSGLLINDTGASFVAGDTYDLQADFYNPGQSAILAIFVNGVGLAGSGTSVGTQTGNVMQHYDYQYTATGSEAGTIAVGIFSPGGIGNFTGVEFDNFQLNQITPAPEPGTLALAAMGGFGMLVLYRRRVA